MKKILLVVLAFVLTLNIALVAFAQNDADIAYTTSYDENTGILTVVASIVDIKDSTGITMVEYDVHYDSSALEFLSATPNMPTKWEPLVESSIAEDLSRLKSTGEYWWAVLVIDPEVAVVEDDELFITVQFKVLEKKNNDIRFECAGIANANLKRLQGPSTDITVAFASDDDVPSIDYSDVENESTENSDVVNNSGDNEHNHDHDHGSDDTSKEISNNDFTSEDNNNVLSVSVDESLSFENSDSSNATDEQASNAVLYVIIGIVVAGAAIVLIVLLKKNKK